MKQIIFILTILILVSCSNKNDQKGSSIVNKSEIDIDTVKIINYTATLNKWINYYNKYSISLDKFNFIDQDCLPDLFANVDTFDIANDIYKPFYKYAPDSSKILDLVSYNLTLEKNEKNELVSYGGEVDTEISIKDLKNKLWKRILFVGPSYLVEDGFWINNNQLIIVGLFSDTNQKIYKPTVWFIDLKLNIIQTFEYENFINNMNCDYLDNIIYKNVKISN